MFVRTGVTRAAKRRVPSRACPLAKAFGVAHHRSAFGVYGATRALVTEIPEKEKTPPMPLGGMDGMDY
jgi:hypothetical protein